MKNAFIQSIAPSLADPTNTSQLWYLVDKDGNHVLENSQQEDFRGDFGLISGGTPPCCKGKAGYVETDAGRFYPSVFGLKWVECDELQSAPAHALPEATPHQAEPIVQEPQRGGFSTVKVSEATGAVLDWLVAKAEGYDQTIQISRTGKSVWAGEFNMYLPSSSWAQGGPIIEREEIGLSPVFCSGVFDCWLASGHDLQYDEVGEYVDGSDHMQHGPTPLIAAMRCFCCAKLGNTAEVPNELL